MIGTPDALPMIVEVTIMMNQNEGHEVRNTTAISGAVVGATAGILGGIAGIGAAGLLGAVFGAIGGLALERNIKRSIEGEDAEGPALESMTKREAEAAVGIEPACEDCVAVREQSAGAVTWCARHEKHHVRAHRHYEYAQGFGAGSMFFRAA